MGSQLHPRSVNHAIGTGMKTSDKQKKFSVCTADIKYIFTHGLFFVYILAKERENVLSYYSHGM